MKKIFLMAISLLLLSVTSFAQERWRLSVRPAVNFPVQKIAGTELKTGFGFDFGAAYKIMPHTYINAGWAWNKFAANVPEAAKTDYEETGYMMGLQFIHPLGSSGLGFMFGVNALYNHIELENAEGDIVADTGHGWGYQLDGGLTINAGKRLQVIPGLRYRSLSRDLRSGAATTTLDLKYLSAGVGLNWRF